MDGFNEEARDIREKLAVLETKIDYPMMRPKPNANGKINNSE